ncbi:MAG: KamA family radical SAM protein [Bacteroidales bacterium]|nr:KamA family radical SAM protein [Bacteroidales bacterium]
MNELTSLQVSQLVDLLWNADPEIKKTLARSASVEEARERLFEYLNSLERHYFNICSQKRFKHAHIIEKANAKECIRVLKNIIRTENEEMTKFSALSHLWQLVRNDSSTSHVSRGFIAEFIHLFRGINANSGITEDKFILPDDDRRASRLRSRKLDEYAVKMNAHLMKFKSGTELSSRAKSSSLRRKILKFFGADEKDWRDYKWHLKHIISDTRTLEKLIHLDSEERQGLIYAEQNKIPFQVTPYYLSLFNEQGKSLEDRVLRAQVLPSLYYCSTVRSNRLLRKNMDFMGEKSTSPVEGITRRYPQIVILKPVDTCPQICVYCQRNWELKPLRQSKPTRSGMMKAIEWIRDNENISEVLITGGDPLILTDDYIGLMLDKLSAIPHIERIRIGSRMLVTLPFRITTPLIGVLKRHHKPGYREICIITHFEHPVEITTDVIHAVKKIRNAGLSIYNQQVFTYYNSRKYETCSLRLALKRAGIDPYYTFNTKGKEETEEFRVPIARLEQERKEEARFLPGIVRTDEPVFNVPKLGKSHLRAWQDHELIMILGSGQRVYRFFPWESKVTLIDDYIYSDVPIYDYFQRLRADQEDLNDYKSIWYYF